ncbi:MAG: glycosyltransferase, partial [Candidatus Omnitrophica bacterium]|nr:glycosyltransferase [Candidatus Omnitrophota bacterium]
MYLFLSFQFVPLIGGAEKFLLYILEKITKKDKVILLTARFKSDLPKKELKGNLIIYRLRYIPLWIIGTLLFLIQLFFFLIVCHKKYNLIFINNPKYEAVLAILLAKIFHKKTILLITTTLCPRDILKENKTKFISFVSLILKKADVFVVLTKEMESYLIEDRIPKKRIRIIPNGVD